MRIVKHLFVVVAMMLLVGCGKDIEVRLSENSHEFEATGGTVEIMLESNGSWQIDACPDWISVSPMSGDGNATLVLTCANNVSSHERSAEIKITTKTNEAVIFVKQAFTEGNTIVFVPNAVNSDFQGGDFPIRVEANCDWSIGPLPAWIHCDPMSGSQSANVVLTIDRFSFSSEGNREYNVDFVADGQHFYLPVSQTNDEEYLVVPNPSVLDLGAEGGVRTVVLQCITLWTLECTADWVAVTPISGDGNGEITVTVSPNLDYVARNTRIILTSSVGCVSSVRVNQEAAINPHYLTVTPDELSFPWTESSLDLTINTDSLWSVVSNDAWINVSSNSGMGDATITVTADANTLLGSRRAELEVISGSLTRIVSINQASGSSSPTLSFNPNHLVVDCGHSFNPVSISANVAWSVRFIDSWVNSAIEQGIGDGEIVIEVKDNFSTEPRMTYAFLSYQGIDYDTLVLEQEARVYYLESSVTELNAERQGASFVVAVTANQDWSVVSNSAWVHFEPGHGSGNGTFRIIVDANNTPMVRTAEVRLSGAVDGMVTITVTQSN